MYELTNETVAGRKYYAKLELDDGTTLTNYGDDAVGITSISLSSTLCGSESVSIGCVNAACVTIVLEAGTALENQRFTLHLGQEFDGAVEWVPMGIFTGTKAEVNEGSLTVEAWDDLYFAGGDYTPSDSVTEECTVATALFDVCDQLGIQFLQSSVPEDVTIAGMPTGLTCSAAIGHLAALCGANACMDREGYLVFRQFTDSDQTLGTDDCYSGGMVFKTSDFTVASLTNTLETETSDDDGETTTETTEVERTTGASGGSIALTNPLMTEDNIDAAWDVVKGFAYRPATLTAVGQIAVDVGDVVTVTDVSGTAYSVPVMTHTLDYDGGLKSTITAAGESESQQSAAVSGPLAQQIKELAASTADIKVLASGKNAVYYAAAAPSADDYTLSVNDLWFDTSGGDYAMYYWDGSEWVAAPFGTSALGDGIITAAKIAAGEVTSEKLNVSELSAITANLGTITGGSININDLFIVDSDGNLTASNAEITGNILSQSSDGYMYTKINAGEIVSVGYDGAVVSAMDEDDEDDTDDEDDEALYYCQLSGGFHCYDNSYSESTSPDGAIQITPLGLYAYYLDALPWLKIYNPSKTLTVNGTLSVGDVTDRNLSSKTYTEFDGDVISSGTVAVTKKLGWCNVHGVASMTEELSSWVQILDSTVVPAPQDGRARYMTVSSWSASYTRPARIRINADGGLCINRGGTFEVNFNITYPIE